MSQGRYWLLTIPRDAWNKPTELPPNTNWIKGQLERGGNTEYEHWQLIVGFGKPTRRAAVKTIFGERCHAELTRSDAADEYVWKEDTAIPDTRFELGTKPFKRASERDWEQFRALAKSGDFDTIPADVVIHYYGNLRKLHADALSPSAIRKVVHVYWGASGTGKSFRAWSEAGLDAYPKDPRSKFWDGYRGQKHVVIDEFRGDGIHISHFLRWLDEYPVNVDIKGSSVSLCAERIWITSNLSPLEWYPLLDEATQISLQRRLVITHFGDTPFTAMGITN